MAAILVYAGVKGYQKYQTKKANSSAGSQNKSRKNRKSISSLVIPSVASAHIIPGSEEYSDDLQPPQYALYEKEASFETPYYTAPFSPDSIGIPTRSAPPPPVMLGITLCESPITPTSVDDNSPVESRSSYRSEIQGDSSFDCSNEVFELAGDDPFLEPMSPAPLNVVKRSSSPLPQLHEEPDMTYSSDENEDCEESHRPRERSTYLEVPRSATDLLDFEPPPIPPKSPARKARVIQIMTN